MRARLRILSAIFLILAAGALLGGCGTNPQTTTETAESSIPPAGPAEPVQRVAAGDRQISGPYTHDNLAIFLIHGEDLLKGRKYMMLAEALEKKLFVIYETQSVNELSMENLSSSEEVLILSGDILKGGQQDRIAQYDQFVPAKSGKLPLTVFCVEHTAGRWNRKMTEEDKTFTASPGQLCFNDLRLANRCRSNQAEVWDGVANAQVNLSKNAGRDVKAKESDSSLALSLQSKEVKAAADRYVARLSPIIEDKADVVGYAFAINGKIYTADMYGSPSLFQRVWPRLLHASAIEAFADLQKDKAFTPATVTAVKTFLEEGDNGKAASKEVTKDIREVTNSGERVVRVETQARAMGAMKKAGGESIRTNYIGR